MIYKYLIIILCFISCNKVTQNAVENKEPTREELHKEYILNLHDRNMEEVFRNQDFINILSVKHYIADSCEK